MRVSSVFVVSWSGLVGLGERDWCSQWVACTDLCDRSLHFGLSVRERLYISRRCWNISYSNDSVLFVGTDTIDRRQDERYRSR